MVLDAFGVAPRRLAIDPERPQESLDELVAGATALREIAAELREKNAAVRPLRNKALLDQALEHFGNGRLRDAQSCGDIDLSGLPTIGDQIGDELDVILEEFHPARFPGLPEAFHLRARVDQRRKLADGTSRGFHRHAFQSGLQVGGRGEINSMS